MSIFSGVAGAEKTFIKWFENEVTKFEKNAPTIEADVENGVKYAVAVLAVVTSQVTADSPAAKLISTAVQDLNVISAVTYDAGAHPTLSGLFNDVVTNLSGLETAVGVKSPATVTTVGKVITTLTTIAQVVAAIVPVVA